MDADKLGMAIGIRPGDRIQRLFREPVLALSLFSMMCIPNTLFEYLKTSTMDSVVEKNCATAAGAKMTFGWNGTMVTRYDFSLTPDGECLFEERKPDYQVKELAFEISKDDRYPISS